MKVRSGVDSPLYGGGESSTPALSFEVWNQESGFQHLHTFCIKPYFIGLCVSVEAILGDSTLGVEKRKMRCGKAKNECFSFVLHRISGYMIASYKRKIIFNTSYF